MEEPSKEFQARKEFLLHQARRARMKFVLQARDFTKQDNITTSEKRDQKETEASCGADSTASTTAAAKLAQQHRCKVPAAECVQQVLDFFHDLLPDDVEAVDVDQLLLSVQDTDVEEDLRNFQETAGSGSLSEYDLFLRKLLLPQAAHIVKLLQQFVLKTQSRYRNLQLLPMSAFGVNTTKTAHDKHSNERSSSSEHGPLTAAEVWEFIDHVCQVMQETELWASGPGSSTLTSVAALAQLPASTATTSGSTTLLPLDPAVEVFVERFVFRKIGDYLFAGDKDEARKNQLTAKRIQALQFVTAEHLDIRSLEGYSAAEIAELISSSSNALAMLSQRSAPSDKVACLRSCCQQVALLLKQLKMKRDNLSSSHQNGNALASLPGADELLPMMIYVVLKTTIPELHSQIRFLQSFTRPKQMLSEAGYLVTQFVSAVYFLDNVDARALMIEPDAFDSAMLQAKQRAKHELVLHQQQHQSHGKKQTNLKSGDAPNNTAESLDLDSILSQYRTGMKSIEQSLSNAESMGSSVGGQHTFPNLREYRTKYQVPKQVVKG